MAELDKILYVQSQFLLCAPHMQYNLLYQNKGNAQREAKY